MGITIANLPAAVSADRLARLPVMKDGVTSYYTVGQVIDLIIGAAPGQLDTLEELAAALNDDADFAATITAALALKAPLASPSLTGTPTVPTASPGTNTTQAASTAFVTAAVAALPVGLTLLQEITPSGTSVDFTSISSGLSHLVVVLDAITTSGTATLCLRLGSSGGFVSTGYADGSIQLAPGGNSSASLSSGIALSSSTAANTFNGRVDLYRVNSTDWVAAGAVGLSGGNVVVGGRLALGAVLDRLRLTTTGGSVTFSGSKLSLFGE
jgi:hypothetical protein